MKTQVHQIRHTLLRSVTLCAVSIALILSCVPTGVSAYSLQGGKLNGGIYGCTVYSNGLPVNYRVPLGDAVADWNWHVNPANNGIGTDVYFQIINTATADIEVSCYDLTAQQYTMAINYMCDDIGSVPSSQNRDFCNITLNTANLPTTNIREELRKCYNHELGHAMGLAHYYNDTGTIMYPYWNVCTAYCPTLDDVNGILAIY